PGIRTTVFLKGCPLRCIWCHNPESQRMEAEYLFDYEVCHGCLGSGFACPLGVRSVTVTEFSVPGSSTVKKEYTADHCRSSLTDESLDTCPKRAVKNVGNSVVVDTLLSEVLEDVSYYQMTGGGLTISGGEPLAQATFARDLAKAAKAQGLHVCLDTSGYATAESFRSILPWIDIFLFDYKATGEDLHKKLTGVGQTRILDNLNLLMEAGATVLLRCPLIPGVNDTPEHFKGILEIAERYPGLKGINVMPYHDMGNHKAARLGESAPLIALPSATPEQISGWMSLLSGAPCPVNLG
ncbi:MAG: glycyl-radical enzyme activating protein, partial [Gorillibacterium sp.]|nr:glycyl-radical enzyme activating protein [Gorillibacterium sp.]